MSSSSQTKRSAHAPSQPAQKRVKLLDDESESDGQDDTLKVNEAYAARFKHNKERAELHRLEGKYGIAHEGESEESSTDDGTEDENGDLADESIDAEISATLNAIRAKDPRIYSNDSKFYSAREISKIALQEDKSKPIFLRDYHRQNLLENGGKLADEEPQTYVQEQDSIKRSIVRDIHAANTDQNGGELDDDEFLVRKQQPSMPRRDQVPLPDPRAAEKDPETFLSNFFAARAWVPSEKSEFQPLESDDEDEDAKAEELEYAWNLRFEDPETSNKTLTSHSRDIVAKYSVRRDEASGRKKVREHEKEGKLQYKLEREEEKRRYKNLKIRQMEEKLGKIREAAGIKGKDVEIDDWTDLLEGEWDDDAWNKEMTQRFGAQYYEDEDVDHDGSSASAAKLRKPQWDDDIDIKDLDPEFEDKQDLPDEILEEDEGERSERVSKKAQRAAEKSTTRRDRRIIEALAEQDLPLTMDYNSSKSFQPFRYRETSPNTFGLTPLDILAAEDTQLNQFAGLKKLATYRDPERKKLDKKKLSKKARLRAWRKETFGREEGPENSAFRILDPSSGIDGASNTQTTELPSGLDQSGHKRKRKKRPKALHAEQ